MSSIVSNARCPTSERMEREFYALQKQWRQLRGSPRHIAPKVVVIGAGPVGLIFTASLLEKHPKATVYLFDKRAPNYTRKQIFALEPSTIRLLPPKAKEEMFDEENSPGVYTLQPGYDRFAKAFSCQAPIKAGPERRFGSITINKFEKIMYNYLKDKYGDTTNLQLFNGTTVNDIDMGTLEITYSGKNEGILVAEKFDYIIATHGYGGEDPVVQKFLGGRVPPYKWEGVPPTPKEHGYTEEETKGYGSICYWTPKNQNNDPLMIRNGYVNYAMTIDQLGEFDPDLRTLGPNAAFRGFRSRTEEYYLGITLTKQEFDRLPNNSISGGNVLEQLKIFQMDQGGTFYDLLDAGMKLYGMQGGDVGSLTVRKFPSKISRAKQPVKVVEVKNQLKVIAAIGDAMFNVHYFTASGVNSGATSADFMSTLIAFEPPHWPQPPQESSKEWRDADALADPNFWVCSVRREDLVKANNYYSCTGFLKYLNQIAFKEDRFWTHANIPPAKLMAEFYKSFVAFLQEGQKGSLWFQRDGKLLENRKKMMEKFIPENVKFLQQQYRMDVHASCGVGSFSVGSNWKRVRYAGGDVYVGEHKDGKRHGNGTYTWANGNVYVGDWKDDKEDGTGTYTWANGAVYVGEYKDDKKDGKGKETYADGDVYFGKFKDDKKDGNGTYTWADGNVYVGEWKDGKRDGKGKMTFNSEKNKGDVYDGEWKDSKYHGKGKYTYNSGPLKGGVYVGEYKDNKKHGYGKFTFADGSIYHDGMWKDNERVR